MDAFLHHAFCYSCVWTENLSLLPESVISPREWMKMCFQLIPHLISYSWVGAREVTKENLNCAV